MSQELTLSCLVLPSLILPVTIISQNRFVQAVHKLP